MSFKTTLLLLLFTGFSFAGVYAAPATQSVPIKEITSLTFNQGMMTNFHRTYAVPQLKCISYHCESYPQPTQVQCQNVGFDGHDVQWRCEATGLPNNYQMGKSSVFCEGYQYPEDPLITVGSCGLEYELILTQMPTHTTTTTQTTIQTHNLPHSSVDFWNVMGFLFVVFVLACLISVCCCPDNPSVTDSIYARPRVYTASPTYVPVYMNSGYGGVSTSTTTTTTTSGGNGSSFFSKPSNPVSFASTSRR